MAKPSHDSPDIWDQWLKGKSSPETHGFLHFLPSNVFQMGKYMGNTWKYPLVNVNKKLWKDPPFFKGKIHYFYGDVP